MNNNMPGYGENDLLQYLAFLNLGNALSDDEEENPELRYIESREEVENKIELRQEHEQ